MNEAYIVAALRRRPQGRAPASKRGLKALRAEPLARIHHGSVLGHDPVIMPEAPSRPPRSPAQAGMRPDIALGHPLGGTRLMATLVHALRRRGERYALQTMRECGGMANVTLVERL